MRAALLSLDFLSHFDIGHFENIQRKCKTYDKLVVTMI